MYLKECKSAYNRDTCTPMFILALFTIAKLWKQLSDPLPNEWIEIICIYTMEHYLAIQKMKLSFAGKFKLEI
jgi:hypothetical protein